MHRLTVTLMLLFITFALHSQRKEKYPRAEIKVEYNYYNHFLRGSDGVVERNIPFVLLVNRNQSKFYYPSTEFKDSLHSTPAGRAKARQMFSAAAAAYIENKDRSAMDGVVYRTRLYVTKDFAKSASTTYDKAGMGRYGFYEEPFSEIDWVISADSTKMILDYSCIMAQADYHGREWSVWFTPEIPIQDGPWKLCGLPGLIMEATETSGQHGFTATGIETSTQTIYPLFSSEYEKMNRLDMLRAERHYQENSHAMFKAATGYDLGGGTDKPATEEGRKFDFLETDYH